MRAFRVLRIFGRVKAMRSIINALTASMFPVYHVSYGEEDTCMSCEEEDTCTCSLYVPGMSY
jgi:hypothetical protein